MFRRSPICLGLACLFLLAAPLPSGSANPPRERTIWNYDGGISLSTDGRIPDGPCFRLNGHLTAETFFNNLRRVDTDTGTLYRRGHDVVTEFPDRMRLTLVIYDELCDISLRRAGTHVFLTKAMITSMQVRFAWKRGMELRPIREIALKHTEARPVEPFSPDAKDLPEMYEWWFNFDLQGKAVPLTDSLVVVFTTPDGHIVARGAARL
jgi:hypothetical protein